VLPVANALKRAWPDTHITWIIQPVPHKLVAGHPAIDEFVLFHRRRGRRGWKSFRDLRRQMKGRHFDLVLNLQVYMKAGIITGLLDGDVKLGFDRARARDLNWLFTTHRIPARPTGHVQDQYLEFVEYLGIDPHPIEWRIDITDAERAEQRAFFERIDAPVMAVVVGTSKPAKNWAPEKYAEALDRIQAGYGLQPVLVGGPSPIERAAADRILELTKSPVIDAIGDDIRRLIWLLDGSALVLSPDTGPLHIANALGREVVGLYGYTNPVRYGPYGRGLDAVVDGYATAPGVKYDASMVYQPDGMSRISVDDVVQAVGRTEAARRASG
ncbi:MAG TPA: glycosyltransferase family 9 protein, partial [Longimicrobiales bacterium]